MAVSVTDVMRYVNNFFEKTRIDGTFSISGGALTPLPACRYLYIQGSAWHDGAYSIKDGKLADVPEVPKETFTGSIYTLHPPNDFIRLCDEIAEFDEKCPLGAFQSESFGDYSYTRGGDSGAVSGGWSAAFGSRLARYRRKMFGGPGEWG